MFSSSIARAITAGAAFGISTVWLVAAANAEDPPPPRTSAAVSRPAVGSAATLPTTRVTFPMRAQDRFVGPGTGAVELVHIPAGKVTLTDEKGRATEHAVKSIWVARYETTWPEFYAFAEGRDLTEAQRNAAENGGYRLRRSYAPPDGGFGIDGYPVGNVTLSSAKRYCEWLSAKSGRKFRLPTEAEWEYACRAGGPPVKPDARALDAVAWTDANAKDQPHPVGQKRPNAWVLYDMLGNVGEHVITADGVETIAGGSYQDAPSDVHSGARETKSDAWSKHDPEIPKNPDWYSYGSAHHIGFRVVMEE